jgi:hypothetical protein
VRKVSLEQARKVLKLRGMKLQLRAAISEQRERLVSINQQLKASRPSPKKGNA